MWKDERQSNIRSIPLMMNLLKYFVINLSTCVSIFISSFLNTVFFYLWLLDFKKSCLLLTLCLSHSLSHSLTFNLSPSPLPLGLWDPAVFSAPPSLSATPPSEAAVSSLSPPAQTAVWRTPPSLCWGEIKRWFRGFNELLVTVWLIVPYK